MEKERRTYLMDKVGLGDLRKANGIHALAEFGNFVKSIVEFMMMLQNMSLEFSVFFFEDSKFISELCDFLFKVLRALDRRDCGD